MTIANSWHAEELQLLRSHDHCQPFLMTRYIYIYIYIYNVYTCICICIPVYIICVCVLVSFPCAWYLTCPIKPSLSIGGPTEGVSDARQDALIQKDPHAYTWTFPRYGNHDLRNNSLHKNVQGKIHINNTFSNSGNHDFSPLFVCTICPGRRTRPIAIPPMSRIIIIIQSMLWSINIIDYNITY